MPRAKRSALILISVRAKPPQRDLIDQASKHLGLSRSEFMVGAACREAKRVLHGPSEIELIDRRHISIPAKDWERVEAFVARPPKNVPALRKLLATKPVWER